MDSRSINIELLLGRKILAKNNQSLGRIEEFRADLVKGECYVTEILTGAYAGFERLSATAIGRAILGILGSYVKTGYRIPWDKLDLSDPERPRITCPISELKQLSI